MDIPRINDNKVKCYYKGEYKGELSTDEFSVLRVQIIENCIKNNNFDTSDWVFIGHKDTNERTKGKEIKITIDKYGNLSDIPWEYAYTRRTMRKLIELGNIVYQITD